MHFPPWIDTRRNSDAKRAQLRLKYMLSRAALDKYGRTSMHDVARDAGLNHSSIFNAINRGYFTVPMAEQIERVFGRDALPREFLTHPLTAMEKVAQ